MLRRPIETAAFTGEVNFSRVRRSPDLGSYQCQGRHAAGESKSRRVSRQPGGELGPVDLCNQKKQIPRSADASGAQKARFAQDDTRGGGRQLRMRIKDGK